MESIVKGNPNYINQAWSVRAPTPYSRIWMGCSVLPSSPDKFLLTGMYSSSPTG